ncbi:flagellar biosynthetic protein FliR [Billgrantia desiderata SP1]|uniref:flagellar biosynthetic protein FliR n=1 Tax=Billgrantia desiderata TaxID=52021 RepID=UPI00089E287E|nr:flagellar biosynthetic protein FliR [Halomonas desiderata]OUE42066.1 flagellar biosynthetic protein FliR [Halomonas desiderata SP1]SEG47834.1 flagellar biosynthetic protein FliR [Halomonas desiderata]
MVEVTFDQLHAWLVLFLWPFVRILAFFQAAPLWGHSSVPNQAKIGLAFLITLVIAPVLPPMPDVPLVSWAGFGILVEQMLIGIAIGLVMHVVFAVVQAAGEFIGLQMGLAFASFFDTGSGTNTMILSRIFFMVTLLMFLALGGHLMVLEALVSSFYGLPIGIGAFNPAAFEMMVRYGGTIFVAGMSLALPLVGSLLIINLAMGILNRSAPQLTVFNIGFPTSLTVGLVLLMVLMTDMSRFLQRLFSNGIQFIYSLIEALAPLT